MGISILGIQAVRAMGSSACARWARAGRDGGGGRKE